MDPVWLAQQFPSLSDLQHIGVGGQKWVFSATHPDEGDIVLKLIRPGQDADRLAREIQAVEQVASARVPRILAVGTVPSNVGPTIWIREQRVMGEPLRTALQSRGPMNVSDALRLACQILEALVDAERVRIVHRDVKPDNIMVDGSGNFWLLDFGLARHLDLQSLTATAAHFGVGTPGYAPPEQFRNLKSDIDVRADLFGLGVTLFESITGLNPYLSGARDMLEIIRRVEQQTLPRLAISADIADFVATLVQRRRDHRPETAAVALEWVQELAVAHSA